VVTSREDRRECDADCGGEAAPTCACEGSLTLYGGDMLTGLAGVPCILIVGLRLSDRAVKLRGFGKGLSCIEFASRISSGDLGAEFADGGR